MFHKFEKGNNATIACHCIFQVNGDDAFDYNTTNGFGNSGRETEAVMFWASFIHSKESLDEAIKNSLNATILKLVQNFSVYQTSLQKKKKVKTFAPI